MLERVACERDARISYAQEYIETLWCEFHISPSSTNDFQISPNHLHIWPGGDYMFIAIPSLDRSFTCTLFMPASHFARLDADPKALLPFFEQNFPGIADHHISAADLQAAILEALERGVPHPNAVRLALERRREQHGDAPPVALVLPAHVQARDAPVRLHAFEPYDQLKERSND